MGGMKSEGWLEVAPVIESKRNIELLSRPRRGVNRRLTTSGIFNPVKLRNPTGGVNLKSNPIDLQRPSGTIQRSLTSLGAECTPTPISTAFPSPASVLDAVDPAAYQAILAERFRSAPICAGTPRILSSRHDAAARSACPVAARVLEPPGDPLTTGARPALRPLPAGLECARVVMHAQDARSGDVEMQDVEPYAAISKALPGASILAGLACTQDGVARVTQVQDAGLQDAEIQDDRDIVVHKHAATSTAAEAADVRHPYIHRALASEWYNQFDHSECVYPRSRVRAGRCRFSGYRVSSLPMILVQRGFDTPRLADRSFLPLLVARGMPSLPTPLTTRTAIPSAVSTPPVSRLRHPTAPPLPAPGALLILARAPRLTTLPGPLAALDSPATAMRYLPPWAPSGNAAAGVVFASSRTRPWITNRVKTGIDSRI
ncbi:hypothetical protein DFH09DRAFT_1100877 [Mycena vulgaris]|nr:hypothetical protein DFH09DRAFT_1100877 [Mycena vulgaris]